MSSLLQGAAPIFGAMLLHRAPLWAASIHRAPPAAALSFALALSACSMPSLPGFGSDDGGSASSEPVIIASAEGANGPIASTATLGGTAVPKDQQMSAQDAARFLAQATFGPVSTEEIAKLQQFGIDQWLAHQFKLAAPSHMDYLREQAPRNENGKPSDEMSYEAVWQQWLYSEAQLRARTAFALSQIFVISNIAPDLNAEAMSSYMDMLNRNAFGSYRTLLQDVTLHPAMGYYLNMMGSEKEDPVKGTHPNENYAREVLQLFSIGLVKLNPDGTPMRDAQGSVIPTYDQSVVEGYA